MMPNWSQIWTNRYFRRISLVLLAVILIGAGTAILLLSLSVNQLGLKETKIDPLNDLLPGASAAAQLKTTTTAPPIIVDIGGAVNKPGVYLLPEASRLADLIEAAGGFKDQLTDSYWLQKNLNLAEKLADSQKYYVPYFGEPISQATNSLAAAENTVTSETKSLVSINTADLATLTTLPGIGEVRGQAIIDNRPYASKEELISKSGLTSKIAAEIDSLIKL